MSDEVVPEGHLHVRTELVVVESRPDLEVKTLARLDQRVDECVAVVDRGVLVDLAAGDQQLSAQSVCEVDVSELDVLVGAAAMVGAHEPAPRAVWHLARLMDAGTADAVYQNIDIIEAYHPEFMVILAGDHVYKMDYELMLQQHVDQNADVTVGVLEVPRRDATGFGVMHVDDEDRIVHFLEKPADPPGIPGNPEMALASMGIYVFSTAYLFELLRHDAANPESSRDFGKDLIPYVVANGKAVAHRFSTSCVKSESEHEDYWRDAGTVDAYWEANIDLTSVVPSLDLYDNNWPIWTYSEISPPAKFVHNEDSRRGLALNSMVSGGCIVSGARVHKSLLFTGVKVHSYAYLDGAVVQPYVEIGRNTRLRNVVIDRGTIIPAGLVVGEDAELDAKRFRRTEKGRVLISQPMIDRLYK